jgi:putative endonuclease
VFQHKSGVVDGFTKKYKCYRLVYYESFAYIREAIAREKELKTWRREKKNALIETMNPEWKDLSEGWYEVRGVPDEGQGDPETKRKVSPHPRQAGDASK